MFTDHISRQAHTRVVCCGGRGTACASGTQRPARAVNSTKRGRQGPRLTVRWLSAGLDVLTDARLSTLSSRVSKPSARKIGYKVLTQYKQVSRLV